MKKQIKNFAGPVAAFIGVHSLCCAPLLLPGLFGAMISGAVIGSIAALGSVVAFGAAAYVHNRQKNTSAHACNSDCDEHGPMRPKTFVRSKPFKHAAMISSGLVLGAVFNNYVIGHSGHDHSKGHDHSHHHDHHQHDGHSHISFSNAPQLYIEAANMAMCHQAGYETPAELENCINAKRQRLEAPLK